MHLKTRRVFDWKGNGRSYSLECRENAAGRFLRCLVTDVDGKRHKIFLPKGKGRIKGWDLLTGNLCSLGARMETEKPKPFREEKTRWKEPNLRRDLPLRDSYVVVARTKSGNQGSVWVDLSDCMPKGDLGTLKFCLVGSWKS